MTSYQLGGTGNDPVETWTLNAESIEYVTEEGDTKPDPPPRRKDSVRD